MSVSELEVELRTVSKLDPNRGESRQEFLDRVARVLARIDQNDWEGMSFDAKDWSNKATNAIQAKETIPDPSPSTSDGADAGGQDEGAPPRRRSEARETTGRDETPPEAPASGEEENVNQEATTETVESRPNKANRKAAPKRAAPKRAAKKAAVKKAVKKAAAPKKTAKREPPAPKRVAAPAPKAAAKTAAKPKRQPAPKAAPKAAKKAAKANGKKPPKASVKRAVKSNGEAARITTLTAAHRLKQEESPLTGIKRLLSRDPSLMAGDLQQILKLNKLKVPEYISIRTARTAFLHTVGVLREEGKLTS